jgi:hypothetical protein
MVKPILDTNETNFTSLGLAVLSMYEEQAF